MFENHKIAVDCSILAYCDHIYKYVISLYTAYFLFLIYSRSPEHFLLHGCHQGKPTSSSWKSPSPRGSQDQVGQPELSRHSLQAVYRKCTASLLYSASIKGNSTEDFLEGVMKPTHIHTLLSSIHSHKLKIQLTQEKYQHKCISTM